MVISKADLDVYVRGEQAQKIFGSWRGRVTIVLLYQHWRASVRNGPTELSKIKQ